jgi:hypothetical protein
MSERRRARTTCLNVFAATRNRVTLNRRQPQQSRLELCRPKKAAPAWSNEPEAGPNRGDDLPADDTQLPSVGL